MPDSKKTQGQNRDAPALSLRGGLSSVNPERRTVDVTWTTGASVKRSGWDGDFYEELSLDPSHVRMSRLNSGAPLLANHDGDDVSSVLGVVESARLDGGKGVATVRFAKPEDNPEAERVFRMVQDGVLRNVSVGYRVHKFERVDPDAKVPTYRAVDWEPYEISAVAMGADAGAGFRSLFPDEEHRSMDPKAEHVAAEKAAEEKRKADLEKAADDARKAERTRVADIQLAVRKAKLGSEFAEKLIAEGVSADAARVAVLDELAERSDATEIDGHPAVEVVVEEREKTLRGAEAALFRRHGLEPVAAEVLRKAAVGKLPPQIVHAFKDIPTDGGGEFGGMRLTEIARTYLARSGVNTGRMTDAQIVDKAMTFRAAGENTISDFGTLLANLMYKTSLGQYALADDTWRSFCGTDSVQDFRPSNRYRIGTFGVLDTVAEGAEFKNKSIPDGLKQTLTVATKGNILALSRQAIINDDMGAIMATAGEYGRAAALSIEVDAYAFLNDNSGLGTTFGSHPFFDDTNANVNDTGAALSVDALEADRQVLVKQKDISSNEYLGLGKPGNMVLLVPTGLAMQAARFNTMEYDSAQSSKFLLPNYARGFFREVVSSPRLTDAARRYIFDMSQNARAIVVAFLNGQQAPFLENRLGWRTDGIEWKLRIDYKLQGFDPKLAVTNAGA